MTTCSFKDLEAPPTVERMMEREDGQTLVVASAGNTARAFAQAASEANLPLGGASRSLKLQVVINASLSGQ